MRLWLVALPCFLIVSGVSRIVYIMSLVVPATARLHILASLSAIVIAHWAQVNPDYKMWNHSTSVHT
jgi:Na+/alanine symporter